MGIGNISHIIWALISWLTFAVITATAYSQVGPITISEALMLQAQYEAALVRHERLEASQ